MLENENQNEEEFDELEEVEIMEELTEEEEKEIEGGASIGKRYSEFYISLPGQPADDILPAYTVKMFFKNTTYVLLDRAITGSCGVRFPWNSSTYVELLYDKSNVRLRVRVYGTNKTWFPVKFHFDYAGKGYMRYKRSVKTDIWNWN